jgi:biopolymer transport protein ExbD
MERKKRKVGQINASSMADISFLLLIFFLVTTSMNVGTGLSRRLPPPVPAQQKLKSADIKKRNIFILHITNQDEIITHGEKTDIRQLRGQVMQFIKNENNDPNLPELITENLPSVGKVTYTKNHVILLETDAGARYQTYIDVQSELVAAYSELRDEFAMQRFGKHYHLLREDLQKTVQSIFSQRISEVQVENIKEKK